MKSKAARSSFILFGIAGLLTLSLHLSAYQRTPSIKQKRISSSEITQLAAGASYVIDLTRPGVIYDLDFSSGRVDLTRIKVKTSKKTIALMDWFPKQLPSGVRKDWTSGHVRIGWPKDFLSLWNRKGGSRPAQGTQSYECNPTACVCHGEDDCIDMYREGGPCTGSGYCDETGETTCVCPTTGAENPD